MHEVVFCDQCNERLECLPDTSHCPRCNAPLPDSDQHSATRLIHQTEVQGGNPRQTRPGAESEPDRLIGNQLHVYRCHSLLGAGGMGRVYLAQHVDLHRKCALKILAPTAELTDLDYVKRFENEGRATAEIVHPNIVTIHALGCVEGSHFLEMEFVAGPTLQQLIDDQGPLPPLKATSLAAQIAEGLGAAHRQQIIHQDLKPDNILLTTAGVPKIADFGLAKRVNPPKDPTSPALVGTPNYMAPELFQGTPASRMTDVYALGVCYFQLLTGKLPFAGRSVNDLMRITAIEALPDIRQDHPEIPLEMVDCVAALLSKAPELRPPSGAAAAQLLRAVLGQIRDIDQLLHEAFKDEPQIVWHREGTLCRIDVVLPGSRQQHVWIESSTPQHHESILMIYSTCCPARIEHYEKALRRNSSLLHGGIAVREIDGELMFVMVDTYPRATVDAEEIRRSTLEVARGADQLEWELTGQDQN